jgi:RHS repeat-associated protein
LAQEELDSASWQHDTCDRLIAATRDNRWRDYEYDRANRLTAVRCSDNTFDERFHLDSRGNRIQSGGAACSYDQMNQLLWDGSREFSYDRLGNQIGERDNLQGTTYSYNGRGQLVGIQNSLGLHIEYVYDALGRRIRKRVGNVITQYQWAGTRLISENTDDGQQVVRRDYLFCPEFLTPLAFREGSELYYMHCGRLHEPLCVTDKRGQIAWKAEYLAFGTARVFVEHVRQPWRLPGQYLDEETGLHYSVVRYYSPAHGRFLSMDPQRLPGASLNYYTYCDGDPVNRVDPTGEISLTLGAVLIGIGIGIAVGAAIGAGVELYKQRNQEKTDWGQVGLAALVGGCLGGISGAIFVVGSAALVGALGVVGAGAAAGAISGAVEYCVTAIGEGEWSWTKFGISVAAGAAAGAVTAGIGGIFAGRAARRAAQEAADRAAQEAADRAAQEAADRAAQEAADRAAQEALDRAAKEAADKAARDALERAAQDAARDATKSGGKGQLSEAGRSLTKHAKGQRAGSKGFPEIKGNQEQINKQASEILDGILHDPNRVVKVRPGKGGEEILQVNRPDGTGAIFKKVNGQWVFSHFAEDLF